MITHYLIVYYLNNEGAMKSRRIRESRVVEPERPVAEPGNLLVNRSPFTDRHALTTLVENVMFGAFGRQNQQPATGPAYHDLDKVLPETAGIPVWRLLQQAETDTYLRARLCLWLSENSMVVANELRAQAVDTIRNTQV